MEDGFEVDVTDLFQVIIDCEKLNVNQPYTAWFDLCPESEYER